MCNGQVIPKGSKKRMVYDTAGKPTEYRLRRLFCPACNSLHTEIPDFISAHKHYSRATIESVISGECDYFSGDDSTIYRWKNS